MSVYRWVLQPLSWTSPSHGLCQINPKPVLLSFPPKFSSSLQVSYSSAIIHYSAFQFHHISAACLTLRLTIPIYSSYYLSQLNLSESISVHLVIPKIFFQNVKPISGICFVLIKSTLCWMQKLCMWHCFRKPLHLVLASSPFYSTVV